jgi:heterogeneous nuclear rnp K-like protein 2
MADSPSAPAVQSQKRPLEDPSSPSNPGDLPEAKRPALDKITKSDAPASLPDPVSPSTVETSKLDEQPKVATANGSAQTHPISTITSPLGSSTNGTSTQNQDESKWLHLRAIISSAEAATIIGKGGENVTQVRRMSGAKCTISDYTRGAVERILTVNGPADAVAKVSFHPY